MLSLKIDLFLGHKPVGMWKLFSQITDKRIGKEKRWTIFCKLRTTGSIERTVMIDFKMCCLYVVLVLQGNVETQLGWSGKFRVFLLLSTGTKSINVDQEKSEL